MANLYLINIKTYKSINLNLNNIITVHQNISNPKYVFCFCCNTKILIQNFFLENTIANYSDSEDLELKIEMNPPLRSLNISLNKYIYNLWAEGATS